jgi:hypothetical protein
MPRRLSDELNELRLRDNLSGSEIVLFYRLPSTSERAAYANDCFRRKGNKFEARMIEARQKHGAKILEGVRDGDFEVPMPGASSEYRPIASDPQSPNYAADWRELVARHAGDLLEILAAHVFDGSASLAPVLPPDEADTSEDEDVEKNLRATSAR